MTDSFEARKNPLQRVISARGFVCKDLVYQSISNLSKSYFVQG